MRITEDIIDLEVNHADKNILKNFVEILSDLASVKPDETALIFISNGDIAKPAMTYSELHELAMKFAAGVRSRVNVGDRVLLLFQSSYEFAVAFFGCLYAGVIPIPLPIPGKRQSDWVRVEGIIESTDAKLAVIVEDFYPKLLVNSRIHIHNLRIAIQSYEDLVSSSPKLPVHVTGSDTAFLQFTSGSTGAPKGVIISHDNLIENQILLKKGFRNFSESVYVSWLPLFHDMGLIGNFLQAIYIGQPFIFMAPNNFLQNPVNWLNAISRYRARVSGAPNFAYDLCAERIKEEDKRELDLSSWEVAFNGAEPIRAGTLKRFSMAFRNCGFKESSFYPCYGTAESTLIISGADKAQSPIYLNVERDSYEKGQIKLHQADSTKEKTVLVSSGKPLFENSVTIVDSETKKALVRMQVGEIWINSPSNSIGYWNNTRHSKATFNNHIHGDIEFKNYLNTGDLGFSDGENIYITGRTKDLLIFNGRNIYPQDIELCSSRSNIALKSERCAAFSIYLDKKERLILVHELKRTHYKNADFDKVIKDIRTSVYKEFTIPIYCIALIKPSTIPMTSSGKIRRQKCKELYINNELGIIKTYFSTVD
ncbi:MULTISPECIES: fatty acyl-AMP ligase [unclassified Serratia (in: enterobacteria)]|uniref:fatty acyl-AMP ligase n=1 Tax=unclassified Serratia (in: enterobacteria) TaxID=2647522 RepID=UPI0030767456